jgi:RNA polymerase sigma-70 factor (ECF subfamily)
MIQPNFDLLAPATPSSDASLSLTAASNLRPAPAPAATAEEDAIVDLVRRADAGEPAAQTELVQRYTRRVAGFVRSIIRQTDAVEDVTQMVFIKMFRRLGRLRDPRVFESWLFTLARNTSLDFIRRRNCRPNTVALDEEVNQIPDPSTGSATGEILAALDRALARLSPLDRSLVTQFVAGESYGTIAERAGLSLATVKVRLHRVRPFLRTWVGQMTETRQKGGKGWRCISGGRTATAVWSPTSLAA